VGNGECGAQPRLGFGNLFSSSEQGPLAGRIILTNGYHRTVEARVGAVIRGRFRFVF
jgi:hypothetical protein